MKLRGLVLIREELVAQELGVEVKHLLLVADPVLHVRVLEIIISKRCSLTTVGMVLHRVTLPRDIIVHVLPVSGIVARSCIILIIGAVIHIEVVVAAGQLGSVVY